MLPKTAANQSNNQTINQSINSNNLLDVSQCFAVAGSLPTSTFCGEKNPLKLACITFNAKIHPQVILVYTYNTINKLTLYKLDNFMWAFSSLWNLSSILPCCSFA